MPSASELFGGSKKEKKPSKYISNLLHASKKRQLEQEIIEERKLKKEREEDETDHTEKEVFITGNYKRKLEERAKFQEDIEKKDYYDRMKDVKKQDDLTKFHSFLLSSGLGTRMTRQGVSSSGQTVCRDTSSSEPAAEAKMKKAVRASEADESGANADVKENETSGDE